MAGALQSDIKEFITCSSTPPSADRVLQSTKSSVLAVSYGIKFLPRAIPLFSVVKESKMWPDWMLMVLFLASVKSGSTSDFRVVSRQDGDIMLGALFPIHSKGSSPDGCGALQVLKCNFVLSWRN